MKSAAPAPLAGAATPRQITHLMVNGKFASAESARLRNDQAMYGSPAIGIGSTRLACRSSLAHRVFLWGHRWACCAVLRAYACEHDGEKQRHWGRAFQKGQPVKGHSCQRPWRLPHGAERFVQGLDYAPEQ